MELPKMTRAQALSWQAAWRRVNALELEELRTLSPAERLRQLGVMMALSRQMGWNAALAAEEEPVRQRWIRLRKAYGR